jgi:hypothetical protein
LRQKNGIAKFVVQYEALINERWRPIVRYDTSHGFAHKDIIHFRDEEDKQPLYFQDFNMAFTFAIQDLKTSQVRLWGQIFILDFGEHRESDLPIRQKERGPHKISARQ